MLSRRMVGLMLLRRRRRPREPFRWSNLTLWEAVWLLCALALAVGFVILTIEDVLID